MNSSEEEILVKIGVNSINSGDIESAINSLNKAVLLYKNNSKAWNGLGICYHKKRNYKKAIECFQNAHRLESENNIILKNYRKAIDKYHQKVSYEQKKKSNINNSFSNKLYIFVIIFSCIILCIVGLSFQTKNYDNYNINSYHEDSTDLQSIGNNSSKTETTNIVNKKLNFEQVNKSKNLNPSLNQGNNFFQNISSAFLKLVGYKTLEDWIEEGNLFEKEFHYTDALKSYEEALKIHPNNIDALIGMGSVLIATYRYKEAEKYYDNAVRLNPENAEIWTNKGMAYGRLGNRKEGELAIIAFDEALKIDPDNVDSLIWKANVCWYIDREQEGIELINHALRINPSNADAWSKKGDLLQSLKRYQEASEAYNEALEIEPSSKWALSGKENADSRYREYKNNELNKNTQINENIERTPEEICAPILSNQCIGPSFLYEDCIAERDYRYLACIAKMEKADMLKRIYRNNP